MITLRLAVPILAIALTVGTLANAQESITDVVQKVQPSVVTIIAYDSNGKKSHFGSGFLVSAKQVVTCAHVLNEAARIDVRTSAGAVHAARGVDALDEAADVARLVLEDAVTGLKPLKLAESAAVRGDRVVVVSSPLGDDSSGREGAVYAVRDVPEMGQILQMTIRLSFGSSGSPVMNLNGDIVGIAISGVADGLSISFATSSKHLKTLKSSGVKPIRKATSGKQREVGHLFAEDAPGKALPYFETLTQADPDDWLAWLTLAKCYEALDRYRDAEAAYKESIRILPEYANAHRDLGVVFAKTDRLADAAEAFREAIRLNPAYANAHMNLGMIYAKQNRLEDALAECKQATHLDPEYAIAHYNLGLVYDELDLHEDALDAFKKAIQLDPKYIDAHDYLGRTYGMLKRYDDAIAACKKIIEIDAKNAPAYMNLGLCYLLNGDKKSALKQHRVLERLDPLLAKKLHGLIYPQ